MLRVIVETFHCRETLREASKGIISGMKGLAEGYSAHLLDAMEILKDSWDSLEETAIENCWLRAQTLPKIMEADLKNAFGGSRLRGESVSDIVLAVENLCLHASVNDPSADLPEIGADIPGWIVEESKEEIRDALLDNGNEAASNIENLVRITFESSDPVYAHVRE